jgi:hypothetical protein
MAAKSWSIPIMGPNPPRYVTLARCPFCDVLLPYDDLEAQAEHMRVVHPYEAVSTATPL